MSRFRRPPYLAWSVVAAIAALLAARYGVWQTKSNAPPEALENGGQYELERVIDGDTLLLANGARVRLIGVDTPEFGGEDRPAEPLAKEASAFAQAFLKGRPVRIELDRERVDRFGRFLAYVHVEEGMLNEALLRAGYARTRLEFNFSDSMKRRFRQAQDAAKKEQLGIWNKKGIEEEH